jgi:hypothetical protein
MNKLFLGLILSTVAMFSCKKDNYIGPDAGLYGTFFDAQTNKPLEQDIILGTTIELREAGYNPVTPQFLIVKTDGTYQNSLLFANTYNVKVVRGNFIEIPAQDVVIENQTKLDFTVTPYIRIKEATIAKVGTKVVATFKLEQNVLNPIRKIGLYAHSDSRVGEPMRLVASEKTINAVSNPATVYTVEIDLPANSSTLKPGLNYYFRVGAAINIPEARLNYAPIVKITI